MIQFSPTLIVSRVVVERNGVSVYDEKFHKGVNVIRGENSSGKSTILNFIFYGLGGDLADWSETALLCNRVILEVGLNGKTATLSRDVSKQAGQPMQIFGGPYEASKQAPRDQWINYPYRRSQSLESFSQVLFRLLGIPEVANEESGNLTIHQILRLLYADQLSPVESLFRFERFDQAPLRDAIGRLLCGAYDSVIYENEIAIKQREKEFSAVSAELKSLFAVLGTAEENLNLDWFNARRGALDQKRDALQREIEIADRQLFSSLEDDEVTLKAQQDAYSKVQELQLALGKKREELDATKLAIADSATFIRGLEHKIQALNESSLVAENLGDIRFSACPACFAPIAATPTTGISCHLCKTSFESNHTHQRVISLINDISVQLKQSRILQTEREKRVDTLTHALEKINDEWLSASRELTATQRLPSTRSKDQLRSLHRQAGYLDREIENLNDKQRVVSLIDQLSKKKDDLNNSINRLQSENEKYRASQRTRLTHAYTLIADEIRELLKHDLRRQDSFENPQSIAFDFSNNKITVDGHTYFSASSRVILKSSFFLGLLAASTKDALFRHPRFCMIDTIEDKGMEPERSHNFQNQILKVSQSAKAEHQIIYATAMLSPDLDDEQYIVGRFSTRDEPTLNIAS